MRPQGATARTYQPTPTLTKRLSAWGLHHFQVCTQSLGQLVRSPFASLMTAAVIGISLALPTGMFLLLENAQRVSLGLDGAIQLMLFLKLSVDDKDAEALAQQFRADPDIGKVTVIKREEALAEYRELSGFADALQALDENPLPAVLMVEPATRFTNADASEALLTRLAQLPQVDIAEFDLEWVRRLQAIIALVKRAVQLLAAVLGLAVLLIVGNTIRLAIHNRRDEIEIANLFGATNAFIRRPFLYTGLWYGLSGSLIAWAVVGVSFWLLAPPARELAGLYHSDFELLALSGGWILALLASGALLGLGGAWVAVTRHLQVIEPR